MKTKIPELPRSDDDIWDGAETMRSTPVKIPICKSHTAKGWHKHDRYTDNHDGTVSCMDCPWGGYLPGYMRVLDGRLIDLRGL